MKTIRMMTRQGIAVYMQWSYEPKENPEALERANKKLAELGIDNAEVYEVAPECFWYSTPMKSINCSVY